MILNITPNLILKLRKDFFPDEMLSSYMVILALYSNEIEMLDNFDDFNISKRAIVIYQNLYRKGFVEQNKEGGSLMFKLTPKGIEFAESFIEKNTKADCSEWIEEWRLLFPTKNFKGKLLRSSVKDCTRIMNEFIEKYKYEKEIIMAATKAYLSQESSENYEFTNQCMWFIKQERKGSKLAAWCESVLGDKDATGRIDSGLRTNMIETVN